MDAYVIHYTPLKERKEHITNELKREGLSSIFVEDYDREVLTASDTEKFDISSVNLGKVSLILKHIEAWRQIVSSAQPYGLIFEDDAVLCSDFLPKLRNYIEELPADFDVLMINSGCDLHIPEEMLIEGIHVYLRGLSCTPWGGFGGTRCTDAYLISKECARKFLEIYDSLEAASINIALDWWMNDLMRKIGARVFWAEPSLVSQGTEIGLFKTSLSS
jgi:GR25 family glycosyltransferase involved in LPS biosynthesis